MKMRLLAGAAMLAAVCFASATPAMAQDEATGPVSVTGSVGIVNEYRFRGVSQSDKELALQGGLTISHESGLYIGTWGSNLAGWGTFEGANMELDLIAGFTAPLGGGAKIDVGATWYMYPGGINNTDFIEPYVKISGTTGPVSLTAGVAYAPKQEALGAWYVDGAASSSGVFTDEGDKNDNLYLWGDVAAGIPDTGLTVKGHIGYSKGNDGLGPYGTSIAPTGEYWDWLVGVDYAIPSTPLTVGVSYIDTDISKSEAAYLQPGFSRGIDGTGSIAGSTVVFSLMAAF